MEIPEHFYVFVDWNNRFVNHNVRNSGRITSSGYGSSLADPVFRQRYINNEVDYLPFVMNPNDTDKEISLFSLSVAAEYSLEFGLENYRSDRYPDKPSRLSGVYAFGDYATCMIAHQLYSWPLENVRQFTLQLDDLTRIHAGNMEVVSYMRSAMRFAAGTEMQMKAYEHYWSGDGDFSMSHFLLADSPIPGRIVWEYIIEGQLKLEGDIDEPFAPDAQLVT